MPDPEQIAVGPAFRSDAAALARLHAASFASGWDERSFTRYLDDPSCLTLVGRARGEGNAVLGFVIARCAGAEADILTLCVAPQARCRGIGKALVTSLGARLATKGVEVLFLEAVEHNHAASALYGAIGFKQVGRRENYYRATRGGSRAAADVLCLELSPP